MSANFKLGEVVIGQNFVNYPGYNGMECEIVGGLEMRRRRLRINGEMTEGVAYAVKWATGEVTCQAPHNLRRRKPPTTGEDRIIAMFKPATKREGAPA